MAPGEILSDSALNSEETSETEAIGDSSSTLSGKFRSDVWNYFSNCTALKRLFANYVTRNMPTLGQLVIFETICNRYH